MKKLNTAPIVDQEFRSLIPPLSDEEYQQLEQNILARRKINDPILLWNDTIVDGHNRFCICIAHGIEFEVKQINFASHEEAKVWIIENQLGRRNLNDVQRIELALCKEEMLRAMARKSQSLAGGDRKSEKSLFSKKTKSNDERIDVHKAIAKDANVSNGTLHNYNQIKNSGNTELLTQIQKGEIKIGTAHRMLLPEIMRQLDEVDRMHEYIKANLPLKNEDYNRDINEKLTRLAEHARRVYEC